jgi:hypothetical protein
MGVFLSAKYPRSGLGDNLARALFCHLSIMQQEDEWSKILWIVMTVALPPKPCSGLETPLGPRKVAQGQGHTQAETKTYVIDNSHQSARGSRPGLWPRLATCLYRGSQGYEGMVGC